MDLPTKKVGYGIQIGDSEMKTTAELIVNGLKLELNDDVTETSLHTICSISDGVPRQKPVVHNLTGHIETGLNTICCITGQPITEGIPWKRVIPSSTGEYLDLMHGMAFKYMSVAAAMAFKGSWNMGSRLIFEDGTMYHPYISAESAAESDRPCWSDLVRSVWPERSGHNCLCIVANDFKKKVWPRASVGPLGPNTPVYLLDTERFVSKNLVIKWSHLIEVLDFVEEVYAAGFSKRAIGKSLFSDYAALSENLRQAMDYEERLALLRPSPEFMVSILIAQRSDK
jgi:hypothetical protein